MAKFMCKLGKSLLPSHIILTQQSSEIQLQSNHFSNSSWGHVPGQIKHVIHADCASHNDTQQNSTLIMWYEHRLLAMPL